MSVQTQWGLTLLTLPFFACSPAGDDIRTLQQGAVSIRVDALLGLDPIDVKAEAMKRIGVQRQNPVRLALDVQLGGGIRGSLATAGLEVKSSVWPLPVLWFQNLKYCWPTSLQGP